MQGAATEPSAAPGAGDEFAPRTDFRPAFFI
jgi:hypothetical protein